MPTYEYKCLKSGKHFERFQGINDPPLMICPECGGKASGRSVPCDTPPCRD